MVDKNAPHYARNYEIMMRIRDGDESEFKKNRNKNKFRHPKWWSNKFSSYEEFRAKHSYFQKKDKNN